MQHDDEAKYPASSQLADVNRQAGVIANTLPSPTKALESKMSHKTWIAKRSMSIDLEYDTSFEIKEGKTYTDDGTTVFGDYICDELFEPGTPGPGTIVVTHPEARKSRKN